MHNFMSHINWATILIKGLLTISIALSTPAQKPFGATKNFNFLFHLFLINIQAIYAEMLVTPNQ